MLDRSIVREIVREMFREAFIERINTSSPFIAEKSEGNLVQAGVSDLVNEQTTQVVAATSEQGIVQGRDTPNHIDETKTTFDSPGDVMLSAEHSLLNHATDRDLHYYFLGVVQSLRQSTHQNHPETVVVPVETVEQDLSR